MVFNVGRKPALSFQQRQHTAISGGIICIDGTGDLLAFLVI